MTVLTDIIEVQISRETTPVSRAGFNIPLFIATHSAFKERARVYTSMNAVSEDFDSTDKAYIAAQAMFGQELTPSQIVIGRRQIPSFTVNVSTVANNTTYTLVISDEVYSYVSDADATAIEIADGLKSVYDGSPLAGITITDNMDGTFVVASTVDWSFSVSANMTAAAAASTETWVEALDAVSDANNMWFGLTTETHQTADVLALAAAIEARKKIYGVSTSSADVITSSTTDIASQLKTLGYDKTFIIYSSGADTQYPECGLMAYQLQEQPGSNTWAYKDIAGVPSDKLTGTATQNLLNKNVISFEEVGGARVTTEGKMVGGEFIDVMVFALWLEARMTERIWFRLVNSKKIPYTAAGATIIESEIRAQLAEGVRVGGIAPAPAFQVFVPNVLSVEPNLRASRILEGITFEARLAGAIHKVKIRGTVTV